MKNLYVAAALMLTVGPAGAQGAKDPEFLQLRAAYLQCEGLKDAAKNGGPAVAGDVAGKCDTIGKAYLDVVTKRGAAERESLIDQAAKRLSR